MTKTELIRLIAKEMNGEITQAQLHDAISLILQQITDHVAEGKRVEIRGLGTFTRRFWGPRHARNPHTKQSWMTQPKAAVHFKAGKLLKESVNDGAQVEDD